MQNNQPTREEVEAFIAALRYGMKVSHKPEFLIALAEGWLKNEAVEREVMRPTLARNTCDHDWRIEEDYEGEPLYYECTKCGCR